MMSDVNVIHLVPALFGERGVVGGAERYALELARAMSSSLPTELLTFGEEDGTETRGSLVIRVIGEPYLVKGQSNNPFHHKLFSVLKTASVVHCHQQHVVASSSAALFCRMTGRRVFVSDLGGGGWDISSYLSTDNWYHGHLHISNYSRRVFGHTHNPRAHVILGGVDTVVFSPDASIERGEEILYVGRLLPHKGINYLIEALTPEMKLTVIGKPDDPEYMDMLRTAARGKQVSFRHEVDDDALVRAYRTARCTVLPSVYETVYGKRTEIPELLGQTLLEGMACGAPALCTNVASMPEVVENGTTGFVVPPNDAAALRERLEWIIHRPELASRMGESARDTVLAKFTWPAVVARCASAYGLPQGLFGESDVRAQR